MKKLILSTFFVSLLAGCAQINKVTDTLQSMAADGRVNKYQRALDKDMVDAYYFINADGSEYGLHADLVDTGYELHELDASMLSIDYTIGNDINA